MRKTALLVLIAGAMTLAHGAFAQDYPNRLIKIVVPYPPGGGNDRMARVLGEKLHKKWGQPVIIENRAGGGGNIGSEYVSSSAPDGYTLLFAAQLNLVIAKSIYANLGFDPDKFTPITVVTTSPNILVVNPNLPIHTLADLIAFARANPTKLSYGSTGIGSSQHLASELLKSMAGIAAVHVPYKGTAPALGDLLAGHIEMMFVEVSNALPYIRAGTLRALATGGENRDPALPDLPTMAEGLPGFTSMQWTGIVAPPETPAAIANQLSDAVAAALKEPDVVKMVSDLRMQAIGSSTANAAAFMATERERWGGIIRAIGAKAE